MDRRKGLQHGQVLKATSQIAYNLIISQIGGNANEIG